MPQQPARGARRRSPGGVRTASVSGSVSAQSNGANAPSSIVVYVHGINQTATAEALKVEWDLALFGHDIGERSRMAYWEDLVRPPGSVAARAFGEQSLDDSVEVDVDGLVESAGCPPTTPMRAPTSKRCSRACRKPARWAQAA